jgi:hypothetical protein
MIFLVRSDRVQPSGRLLASSEHLRGSTALDSEPSKSQQLRGMASFGARSVVLRDWTAAGWLGVSGDNPTGC